jgi:AraC-like DNA-binding protein
VRHLLAVLAADGVDVAPLRRAGGLEQAHLDDPDARVPLRSATAVWAEAVRVTGDPALGLHVADRLERGALGVLEYGVRHSATLRQGLAQIVRYGRLAHDLAAFELVEERGEARLELRTPGSPEPLAQSAQFLLAAVLALLRDCVEERLDLREVLFAHADPGNSREYRRILRGPVRFGQPGRAIVLESRQLALPLREADPALGRILDHYLERALAALPPAHSFPARVRRLVAESMSSTEPAVGTVARRLGVSVRTLNRRLAAEGESLSDLRNGVRRELAVAHLSDRQLGTAEVAFLLGFSEASAFHRWFRRVEGVTPGAFRRAQHVAP